MNICSSAIKYLINIFNENMKETNKLKMDFQKLSLFYKAETTQFYNYTGLTQHVDVFQIKTHICLFDSYFYGSSLPQIMPSDHCLEIK